MISGICLHENLNSESASRALPLSLLLNSLRGPIVRKHTEAASANTLYGPASCAESVAQNLRVLTRQDSHDKTYMIHVNVHSS